MRIHRALATPFSWASWASLAFTFLGCTGIVGISDLPPATDESSSSLQSSNATSQGGSTAAQSRSSSSTASRGSSTTSGSTTSVSAASMSSGPPCGAPTSGGIALSNDYQTVLGYGGYCYAYSDSSQGCSPCGTSTACTSATQSVLCAAGVSAPTSGGGARVNYGSGFGCSLNQGGAVNGVAPAPQTFAARGSGVAYLLDRTPPAGTNLAIDDAGTEYFCPISTASGTCTWAMFGTTPGNAMTNVTLTAPPSEATHVHVQIDSGATSEAWSLCITSLSFTGTTTMLAGIGDPCVYDSDCASGLCDVTTTGDTGWCTVSCNYDSDCYGGQSGSVNAQGTSNYCVSTQGGTNYCFPGCASSLDCPFTGTRCTVVGVDEVCSK